MTFLASGARVALLDREREICGWGLYHRHSRIAVRLVKRGGEPFDDAWFRGRAEAAADRRLGDATVSGDSDAWRVINAEGDDFPGLVVDRYGDTLSAEAYTVHAIPIFETILPVLHEKLGTKHHRLEFGEKACPSGTRAPARAALVRLPEMGQDHRERPSVRSAPRRPQDRFLLRPARKPPPASPRSRAGKSMLDVCCYTGGFALAAAKGGASEVLGIDLDEDAIARAQRNANLNSTRVKFVHSDAFSYLRTMDRNDRRYDVVVLDPPKFISGRHEWEEGIARYHDMNKLALKLVSSGGWLLTCSCSGVLPIADFQEIVRKAAGVLGRTVRVIETVGPGRDHPFPARRSGRRLLQGALASRRIAAADRYCGSMICPTSIVFAPPRLRP